MTPISRKEVLPILLAPSPALQLHAQNALTSMHPTPGELPAQAQLRGLIYAVRWEAGIPSSTLLSYALEGERWLVWAAGNVCCSNSCSDEALIVI